MFSCLFPHDRFSYKAVGQSMLHRGVYDFLHLVSDPTTFSEYSLGKPTKLPEWARPVVAPHIRVAVGVSESAQTPRGTLHSGDIVSCGPGLLARLKLIIYHDGGYLGVIAPFVKEPGSLQCLSAESDPCAVPLQQLSSAMCYIEYGGRIFV
jgi:hypothetical protein